MVRRLPHLHIECVAQPITRGIMRLQLQVTSDFDWSDRDHRGAEPFWIWVEDGENEYIYHAESFLLQV